MVISMMMQVIVQLASSRSTWCFQTVTFERQLFGIAFKFSILLPVLQIFGAILLDNMEVMVLQWRSYAGSTRGQRMTRTQWLVRRTLENVFFSQKRHLHFPPLFVWLLQYFLRPLWLFLLSIVVVLSPELRGQKRRAIIQSCLTYLNHNLCCFCFNF